MIRGLQNPLSLIFLLIFVNISLSFTEESSCGSVFKRSAILLLPPPPAGLVGIFSEDEVLSVYESHLPQIRLYVDRAMYLLRIPEADRDEFINACYLLIRGFCRRFDPARGKTIDHYINIYLRNAILNLGMDFTKITRSDWQIHLKFYFQARQQLLQETDNGFYEPSEEEVKAIWRVLYIKRFQKRHKKLPAEEKIERAWLLLKSKIQKRDTLSHSKEVHHPEGDSLWIDFIPDENQRTPVEWAILSEENGWGDPFLKYMEPLIASLTDLTLSSLKARDPITGRGDQRALRPLLAKLYLLGWSYQEIGDYLNCTRANISTLLQRFLKKHSQFQLIRNSDVRDYVAGELAFENKLEALQFLLPEERLLLDRIKEKNLITLEARRLCHKKK